MKQEWSQQMEAGLRALEDFSLRHSKPLISRGIEKEGLRVNSKLDIAQSDHPSSLGHPLTHTRITTDYSEALLELITPVHSDLGSLFADLRETHQFVLNNIGEEVLWAGSMPSRLDGNDSVRIAEYGDSNIGQLKHVYRKGLDVRYGRVMQSIAGLHFNFSLDDAFWETLQAQEASEDKRNLSLQTYKSERYFGLTRNFRRYSWLLMYLFGASPVLDASFLEHPEQVTDNALEAFDSKGSYYRPYATSLRMSDLGYNNNAQSSLNICFNTLDNFTTTLGDAVKTSYPAYEKIGTLVDGAYRQLNTNILQIENEYYSAIRPKRTANSGEKPTKALQERGVEYVEVRCLDLNPYETLGMNKQQAEFMDCFLLMCLFEGSPFFDGAQCAESENNFATTCTLGRKPGLMLQVDGEEKALNAWALSIFERLESTAAALDVQSGGNQYAQAIASQLKKVNDSSLCPSAKVLADMKEQDMSWLELCASLSEKHKQTLTSSIALNVVASFSRLAEDSLEQERHIHADDMQQAVDFDTYLANYLAS